MNKVASIILNRNLPKETNRLVEHLKKFDDEYTDIFLFSKFYNANLNFHFC